MQALWAGKIEPVAGPVSAHAGADSQAVLTATISIRQRHLLCWQVFVCPGTAPQAPAFPGKFFFSAISFFSPPSSPRPLNQGASWQGGDLTRFSFVLQAMQSPVAGSIWESVWCHFPFLHTEPSQKGKYLAILGVSLFPWHW